MKMIVRAGAAAVLSLASALFAADSPPGLKISSQKHPEDKIAFTTANGETIITVTCSSGIGDVTIERSAEKWPAKIRVIMQYADGKPYTKLEGFTVLFGVADGDRQVEAQAVIDGGSALITPPAAADVRKTVRLSWVDFYR